VASRSLRCYPTSDKQLLASAMDAFLDLEMAADAEVADELAERLRPMYPAIVVRRIEVIAKQRPDDEVWYVYRDGSS